MSWKKNTILEYSSCYAYIYIYDTYIYIYILKLFILNVIVLYLCHVVFSYTHFLNDSTLGDCPWRFDQACAAETNMTGIAL